MESPLQARGCVLYAANSNRAVDVAAEAKRRRNEIERNLAKKHEECILTDWVTRISNSDRMGDTNYW